jgi:hypothetical protein
LLEDKRGISKDLGGGNNALKIAFKVIFEYAGVNEFIRNVDKMSFITNLLQNIGNIVINISSG